MADAQLAEFQKELNKGLANKEKKEQRYKRERDDIRKDLKKLKNVLIHLQEESKNATAVAVAVQAEKDSLAAEKASLTAEKIRLEAEVQAEKAKLQKLENQRKHEDEQCEKEKAKYVQFVREHIAALGAGSDSDDEGAEAAGAGAGGSHIDTPSNLNF